MNKNIDNNVKEKTVEIISDIISETREEKNPDKPTTKRKKFKKYSSQESKNRSRQKVEEETEKEKPINPVHISMQELYKMKTAELKALCAKRGVNVNNGINSLKQILIFNLIKKEAELSFYNLVVTFTGVVELKNNNTYGFVRSAFNDYKSSAEDVYVNMSMTKKYGLKTGDTISGEATIIKSKEKHISLTKVTHINLYPIESRPEPVILENEITEYPNTRIIFETSSSNYCARTLDLITPMGLGQRAIISAPPRAGKTGLVKVIAQSIRKNHPNIKLLILLIDERPEEVTDMRQSIQGAEVVASTFDEDPEAQIHIAEMVYNKSKRLGEYGHDVFVIIDSIGRLTRSFNQLQSNTGRSLSGGIDANALYKTKKFIGLARNIKDGGSISIVGSCLIGTNSKFDEVVHEEFKGRGNCDIYLSSNLSNRRIFPAIDIEKSGTRKEEALLHKDELAKHVKLRRDLAAYGLIEQTSLLLNRLKETKTNIEFLMSL